jgi:hypothetical protein
MHQIQASRPVEQPSAVAFGSAPKSGARRSPQGWPEGGLDLAEGLQRVLTIDDRQWHALKAQRSRRAAEQLAGALVQLLAADDPRQAVAGEARLRAIELTSSALAWLKGDLKDPGCPDHGR